jgi:anti-sigma-K factor RskA
LSEERNGHEAIQELAGAAALRALTPDETRFVRVHLATCADCSRAYAELAAVADLLLRVPEPVAPPAALRQRILEMAERIPQESAAPAPISERPRRRFDWRDLALVASLAATLFFGWTTLRLQDELQVQSARLSQTEPLVRAAASGSRVVPLAGTAQAPQVRGAATDTQLYLESLPQPPPDRVYQVWLIPPGGQPIGVGTSQPGQGGTQTITLSRPLTGMETIALTQEPAPNGSPGPTTPILAAARL